FVDKSREKLSELKRQVDRAWDDGRLLYPEKHPEVAKLKEEYDRLYREVYGGDPFAQATEAAAQDERLMDRVERFLAESPEHRALLEAKTRDGRAIELEKNPEVRQQILDGMKEHEGPDT
ncbi:MAG TPA: hypothetical protein VF653_13240, partial [Methylomirabilota bacterium]